MNGRSRRRRHTLCATVNFSDTDATPRVTRTPHTRDTPVKPGDDHHHDLRRLLIRRGPSPSTRRQRRRHEHAPGEGVLVRRRHRVRRRVSVRPHPIRISGGAIFTGRAALVRVRVRVPVVLRMRGPRSRRWRRVRLQAQVIERKIAGE